MTKRTDIHKPSLADPSEYTFMAAFYQGTSDAMHRAYADEHREYDTALRSFNLFEGNHAAKTTCDHCGAAFAHGALFLHTPTQNLIHVGHICASDTLGLPDRAAATRRRAEKAAAAEKAMENAKAAYTAWREENADVIAYLATEQTRESAYRDAIEAHNETGSPMPTKWDAPHPFINDMVISFNRYGGLTEGQTRATRKFMAKAIEFAARRAEQAEKKDDEIVPELPVMEGRRPVGGRILSAKWKHSDFYGDTLKMLVLEIDGNKVWGTVPASLGENIDDLVGKTVEFTASVERSRDDEHFGFFKRPSGATIVG